MDSSVQCGRAGGQPSGSVTPPLPAYPTPVLSQSPKSLGLIVGQDILHAMDILSSRTCSCLLSVSSSLPPSPQPHHRLQVPGGGQGVWTSV